MKKNFFILCLLLGATLVTYAEDTRELAFNFYKKEASSYLEQTTQNSKSYAYALANGLGTWINQNFEDKSVQEAFLLQTQLFVASDKYGEALVNLFRFRHLFPTVELSAIQPLFTQSAIALHRDYRELANQIFSATLEEKSTIVEKEAATLYQLSKLQGKNFYLPACNAFEAFFQHYPSYKGADLVELWYGDLHRINGNYLAAISQYKKAGELYPSTPYKAASLRLIGDIYADNLKDTPSAYATYTKVLHEFPTSNEIGVVYKHMAILDENNKQYDSAIINYTKAIEILGNDNATYDAYTGKADVYIKTKQYKEAYDTLSKAAFVFTKDETKFINCLTRAATIAKKNLKDYSLYTQTLERILLTYPNTASAPQLMLDLGKGYEYLGKDAQALDTYKKLIIRFPIHKLASQAQGRVNKLTK